MGAHVHCMPLLLFVWGAAAVSLPAYYACFGIMLHHLLRLCVILLGHVLHHAVTTVALASRFSPLARAPLPAWAMSLPEGDHPHSRWKES